MNSSISITAPNGDALRRDYTTNSGILTSAQRAWITAIATTVTLLLVIVLGATG